MFTLRGRLNIPSIRGSAEAIVPFTNGPKISSHFILFFRSGRHRTRQLTIYRSSVQIALPYHPSLAGSTARAKTKAKTMEAMAQGLDDC